MRTHWILVISLLSLTLGSCGSSVEADQQSQPAEGDNTQMNPSIPTPSVMEGLIEKAKEDLAQRLSIPIGDISLVEATIVVWPDASIGCPQPGMLYKQVPEDGALIVLKTKEASYEYHNGGRRGLFLCEKAAAIPKKTPQLDTSILTPPIFNDNNNPPALTPDNSIPPGESQ